MKNLSYRVALGGIVAALCVVLLFLTGVFPFATYALPALAGVLLILIVMEIGVKWAWLTYAAVAILALIVTPDMEAKLLFVLFFGYYPIIKAKLEHIRNRVLEWAVKLLLFNASIAAVYGLILYVFSVAEVVEEWGKYGIPVLFIGANVTFVTYDIALTKLISEYVARIRPRLLRRVK